MREVEINDIADVSFPPRLFVAGVFIFACFAVLVAGLWRLQVVQGKDYRILSEENRLKLIPVASPRGIIYDRDMRMLVDNRPAFNAGVIPEEIDDIGEVAAKISELTGITPDEIRKTIEKSGVRKFNVVTIKRDMDREAATRLEERKWDIPGLVVELAARRNYVYGALAPHLLGYTGEINGKELKSHSANGYRQGDYIGKSGVEKTNNGILDGKKGWKWRVVNAVGREGPSTVPLLLENRAPEPGDSIVLTIDERVQAAAEAALGERKGAVVAMDPRTGEVLALASNPGYDPNIFAREGMRAEVSALFASEDNALMDRSIQGQYPLGSVFKLVIAVAALQEGAVTAQTRISCGGVYHLPGSRATFRCWNRGGHGSQDLSSAIKNSCNVYFYTAGVKLGIDKMEKYARMFGFGSRTKVDLPYESPGLLPSEKWKRETFNDNWYPGESAVLAIGQGYLRVTPLQVAAAVSAIANGGTLYRPRLLKAVLPAGGGDAVESVPEITNKINVNPEYIDLVKEGMRRVVCEEGGTARRARVDGIQVAGKTGTAQTVSRNSTVTGEKAQSHAWFAGFAPFEDPQVAVVAFVEHGGYGGSVAAPVAQAVIEAAVRDVAMADGGGQ